MAATILDSKGDGRGRLSVMGNDSGQLLELSEQETGSGKAEADDGVSFQCCGCKSAGWCLGGRQFGLEQMAGTLNGLDFGRMVPGPLACNCSLYPYVCFACPMMEWLTYFCAIPRVVFEPQLQPPFAH
jgi:hypothetical protein